MFVRTENGDCAGFSFSCVSGFLTLTFSWQALAFTANRRAGGIDTSNCITNVKLSLAGRDFLQPQNNRVGLDDPRSTLLVSASASQLEENVENMLCVDEGKVGGRWRGMGGIEAGPLQPQLNGVDSDLESIKVYLLAPARAPCLPRVSPGGRLHPSEGVTAALAQGLDGCPAGPRGLAPSLGAADWIHNPLSLRA